MSTIKRNLGRIKIYYNYVDEDWEERNFREYSVLIRLNKLKNLPEVMKKMKEHVPYARLIRKIELIPQTRRKEYLFI
ncbi:hypothetical protein ATH33_0029 [Thermoactinomyces vulgaris]|jgi:hypothetical protein|nr:hypothetical protein ATH33_0029 [Thermoactinomyces vulgaris]